MSSIQNIRWRFVINSEQKTKKRIKREATSAGEIKTEKGREP